MERNQEQDSYKRARGLIDSGDFSEAASLLAAIVTRYMPDLPAQGEALSRVFTDASYWYWNCLTELGRYSEALDFARRVFAATHHLAQELKWSLAREGLYSEAEHILGTTPNEYADMLVGLAWSAMEFDEFDIACSYFVRRLAFHERAIDIRHTLNYACALTLAGRCVEARTLMVYLLDSGGIRPASFRRLASTLIALAFFEEGDKDRARANVARLCGKQTASQCSAWLMVELLHPAVQPRVDDMLQTVIT